MKLDLFSPLVASALVAVIGWYVAYLAAIRRDRVQKTPGTERAKPHRRL